MSATLLSLDRMHDDYVTVLSRVLPRTTIPVSLALRADRRMMSGE